MDTAGSLQNLANKPFQREFAQWVMQWFNTDFTQDFTMKPDAPELACLLQAVGFQLRGFEKSEDPNEDNAPKSECLRVVIECGSTKMRAVMELEGVNCHCPNVDDAKDASFWSVSGTGPIGSMDNINKVEETGSNLLPSVSKEATNVIRDIIHRLFKMVRDAPDAKQITKSYMDLSAVETDLKISPIPGSGSLTRSYTHPDIHQGRYRSMDNLTGSSEVESIKGLPAPRQLSSSTTNSSSSELAKLHFKQDQPRTKESLKNGKDTVDTISPCPRASNPAVPNPPGLRRENTWNMQLDIAAAGPSQPNVSSSPHAMPHLCTSLGRVSLQKEERDVALTDTLLEAKHYLERALKMLSNNAPSSGATAGEREKFLKPLPPRSSSFKISPESTSRSSSSCSLPSRSMTKNTTILKPTVRRSTGSMFPKSPKDKKSSPNTKTVVQRKSIGTPTHSTKLPLPKFDTPRPGTSGSDTTMSTSFTSRIFVPAKRRVSPDPKNSPLQMPKSSSFPNTSVTKPPSGLPKFVPTTGSVKPTIGSNVSKFGFVRKKL